MNIYLASSWRNERQQQVLNLLRDAGHNVYDFKNPQKGNTGFGWSEIDEAWRAWSGDAFRNALQHPRAVEGFGFDMGALKWCDACVLLLPCGKSAHLELGWAAGAGKRTIVFFDGAAHEPELMYKMCDTICISEAELLGALGAMQFDMVVPVGAESEASGR